MARTLAQAQEMRAAVYAAWLKAVTAESYSESSDGGGITVSRPRLDVLKKQLDDLDQEIAALTSGGIRVIGVTPVD
jgi:hypothetical protein